MAAVIFFGAVSCAKEDISSSLAGGEVEVTFTANLPELGTRAYGDGANANLLRYWVYDASNGQELTALSNQTPAKEKGKFTFTLPLIKGMTYKLAFWADKNAYNINGDVVTVEYGNANDDTIDAFYALIEEFDPAKAEDQHKTSVTLNRPFAQLNALTDDFAAVALSGVDIETSTVKVVAYTQFNVANGDVVDGASAAKCRKWTDADGIMIGRASFGDPWVFAQAKAVFNGEPIPEKPPLFDRVNVAVKQFELAREDKGEHIACLEARKHFSWYLRGVAHSNYYKSQISAIQTMDDIYRIAQGIQKDLE